MVLFATNKNARCQHLFFFSFLPAVLTVNVLLDKIKHAVGRSYVSDDVLQMVRKHSYSLL